MNVEWMNEYTQLKIEWDEKLYLSKIIFYRIVHTRKEMEITYMSIIKHMEN